MIDPGYIPEDLTQYLLNYSGNEEELNSCGNKQIYETDSSDYGSIFIPPYASTPREPQPKQECSSFQDSGMSEDDSDLSPPKNRTKKNIHEAPNSGKSKSPKENSKPASQQKATKRLQSNSDCSSASSVKSNKRKKPLTQSIKKKSSEKSEKPKKVTTAQNGSRNSKNRSRKAVSTSVEILQDVTSISNKSSSKTNVLHKDTLGVALEDKLDSKTRSKICAKKQQLSLDKIQGNSPPNLSRKKKKVNNSEEMDRILAAHPNQDAENSVAMEIIGDISSSEDESDVNPQSTGNTSTYQVNVNDCQADADDILPQNDLRNQNSSKNFQATADGSVDNLTSNESSDNQIDSKVNNNSFTDVKEPSRKITSISIDISSTEESENHSSVSPRKKATKSNSKAKKIHAMPPEDKQDNSASLFNPTEEMVAYLQKNKNKNVPLGVHNECRNSSKPKMSSTDKAESKKNKAKDVNKQNGSDGKDERNSVSRQGKKVTSQTSKSPKNSVIKRDNNGKRASCPEKNTSVQSPPNTTKFDRNKLYREKKKKYVEDLENEVESLRKENESLKNTIKVNNCNVSNSINNVTDKGMGLDTKDVQYDMGNSQVKKKHQENTTEMSLFIQDLKEEIQQLQREKRNLISVEDMESIVDDLKGKVTQLKKQKKDLEIKWKETDLLVCGLRKELEGLQTQSNSKSTVKDFSDEIPALQKEKNELKSKAKEMELFIEHLKNEIKDLTAEKEGFTRSDEEMKLLVNKSKEEIKALKKSKDDLVSNEKKMKLNLNDLREKIDELKKQIDDHEKNARETDSVMKYLREELGKLKREKAVAEGNAAEMESTIDNLKSEISALKKKNKEQETNFENMEKEKLDYQSSAKEMDSVISSLKGRILQLEQEEETYKSNVKELECMINNLKDEISNHKIEREVQEKKQKEGDTLIKDLRNENIELKNKLKNKDDSIAQQLEGKSGQLLTGYAETACLLEEEAPLIKNTDIDDREVRNLSDKDYEEETELEKAKEDLKQGDGKISIILQDMKNELDQLKNEKEKSKKISENMVTVVQSMKEDLHKLKRNEKDTFICDDVKGHQSRKEKGSCLTAQDMSYFVKDLKDEIGYLKGLIINQSELSALAKHVGTFSGFESSDKLASGKRKLDSLSNNPGDQNKRQKTGNDVSTVTPAGVCLHVNNGKMSVEFCSSCSMSSSS